MIDLFANTWALVTGASSGIGEEFARQLAVLKTTLILTARSGDKLRALAQALAAEHHIACESIALDLSAADGADRLCQELTARHLSVDHLISNAGFGFTGALLKSDLLR